jgi:outer membrane protein OmpA-like peptidoglycan-associated protein
MWHLCVYLLILPFIAGCSLFSKQRHCPEATIVSNDDECDIFYLQKPLRTVGIDILQTSYNYAKSDIVASVFFDFDKATIRKESVADLVSVSRFFANYPELKALVVGHCDHFGAAHYNKFLGYRRAENVRAKLIEFGMDEANIITVSVGSEQAYEQSADKSATIVDRRADIVMFKPPFVASGEQNDGDVAKD